MLNEIKLTNFKCFKDVTIPLAPFTLLAGLNGMGKSSVIQSLLLLRQSWDNGDLIDGRLSLSGELTDLGTGSDVLFDGAEEDIIGIGLASLNGRGEVVRGEFHYGYIREADQLSSALNFDLHAEILRSSEGSGASIFGGEFHYIFAERFGPRKMLPLSESHVREKNIGIRGEFVFHFLLRYGSKIEISKDDPRFSPVHHAANDEDGSLLINQVDAWLQEISPGCHLTIEALRRADSALGGFEFDRPNDVRTRPFRPTNVGFGLSYVLPVIVALLSSPKGATVLLENPEAHMHPRGQTRLGQLAARAAAAGVQVIVETHSDHFMDGARIDIRDGVLSNKIAAFHYFERRGIEANVISPHIDSDGRLDCWPGGFFDQHEENMAQLLAPKFER